jgi:glycosyltransferase involved in cell wall biosynthesis
MPGVANPQDFRWGVIIRILHVTKKYPDAIGGDARVVFNLEREQRRRGHEVFILTSNCTEIMQKENVFRFGLTDRVANLDVVTFRRILSLIILFITGLFLLHRLKPDIIHSHSPDIGFIISLQATLFHIPVVNTCHGVTFSGEQFSPIKGLIESFLLKYGRFKEIVTVDRGSLPSFAEHAINVVRYIPNGVDIEYFARRGFEKPESPKIRYLFVGRLEEQKGLKYLIQASKQLSLDLQDYELIIIGEGSQRDELSQMVSEMSLHTHVRILGEVDLEELKRWYHSCDVFILPSIWEGMPLTLLEAWAAGLPAIVTAVGDVPHLCNDRENAMIVHPGDPGALCNAMLLLANDTQLRDKLGRCGAKMVNDSYSWSNVADSYLDLYKSVS